MFSGNRLQKPLKIHCTRCLDLEAMFQSIKVGITSEEINQTLIIVHGQENKRPIQRKTKSIVKHLA